LNRKECKGCEYLLTYDMIGVAMDYCKYPKHKMKLSYVGECEKGDR